MCSELMCDTVFRLLEQLLGIFDSGISSLSDVTKPGSHGRSLSSYFGQNQTPQPHNAFSISSTTHRQSQLKQVRRFSVIIILFIRNAHKRDVIILRI